MLEGGARGKQKTFAVQTPSIRTQGKTLPVPLALGAGAVAQGEVPVPGCEPALSRELFCFVSSLCPLNTPFPPAQGAGCPQPGILPKN